jgi:hypothetical protein
VAFCNVLLTPRPLGPLYDLAQRIRGKLLALLEEGAPCAAIFSAVLDETHHEQPLSLLVISCGLSKLGPSCAPEFWLSGVKRMQELTAAVCARVGTRWSLFFAALGVLIALFLLTLPGMRGLLSDFPPELGYGIAVGLLTLCLSAAVLGRLAGRIVYLGGNKILVDLAIGIMLSIGCVILAALAGSTVGVLIDASKQSLPNSHALGVIIGLSLLILLYGGIPAVLLGIVYGVLMKITLDRKLKREPAA